MTGVDMLRTLLEPRLSEHQERRTAAIKAFVRKQYSDDQEVRFKQVELQNKLLTLFIDVPLVARRPQSHPERQHFYIRQALMRQLFATGDVDAMDVTDIVPDAMPPEHLYARGERDAAGAATVMLNPFVQRDIPQMVLEGAPGQGKSTLTQYICQVHRMHILEKTGDLAEIPAHHKLTSVRIPFRVDLRDLATWLNKQDPFSADDSKTLPERWHKSLEAFLSAQVQHHSGGIDFSVTDLHAVAKHSPLLLVLDGLDEVVDILIVQRDIEPATDVAWQTTDTDVSQGTPSQRL